MVGGMLNHESLCAGRAALAASIALCAAVMACSRPARDAAVPVSAARNSEKAPSSPPTPAPSDWKGLFDSDSQPINVPLPPGSDTDVLRSQPSCSRVDTATTGSFTNARQDERAYLLTCGATHRLLIVGEHAVVRSLDVTADTLQDAGDLDWQGGHELLLIEHQGSKLELRVLSAQGAKLSVVYRFVATPGLCEHVVISYRLMGSNLEYRVEKAPKRCAL